MFQHDYKVNDPKGWCGDPKRGAALGRHSHHGEASFAGKLRLQRVRLDRGGYDCLGTYWGIGAPLYWIADDDCAIDYCIRAADRDAAKARVRERYPNARFYR